MCPPLTVITTTKLETPTKVLSTVKKVVKVKDQAGDEDDTRQKLKTDPKQFGLTRVVTTMLVSVKLDV